MFNEGLFGSTKVRGVEGMFAVEVYERDDADPPAPLVVYGAGADLGE